MRVCVSVCLLSMGTILFDYRFLLPYGVVVCCFRISKVIKRSDVCATTCMKRAPCQAYGRLLLWLILLVYCYCSVRCGKGCVFVTVTTANALLKKHTTHIIHAIHSHAFDRPTLFSYQQSIYLYTYRVRCIQSSHAHTRTERIHIQDSPTMNGNIFLSALSFSFCSRATHGTWYDCAYV